jgi:IMP dehydrogenase
MATILDSLTFDDVLLVPNYNPIESRRDVSTAVELGTYKFNIPLISANMDTITGKDMAFTMGAVLGGLGIIHRFQTPDAQGREWDSAYASGQGYPVGVAVGVSDVAEVKRAEHLYSLGARLFCIDIAHAHSKLMGKMLKRLRDWPDVFIIAGNVATYSGADSLASWGAHAIKVGIGAGSVCTTREKTGFGVPQLTAIMDCAKVDVPIIADGGIRKPGDVVKALAAGATMVMLGGMIAGTDETPGEMTCSERCEPQPCDCPQKFRRYRGMASTEAQTDYFGTVADWKTDEGVAMWLKAQGPVENIVNDVIGGLRSGLTYAGARNIKELHRKATFVRISTATHIEGTPHQGLARG